jgi:hypothetical protein
MVSKLSAIFFGLFIPDPDFLPNPDPGVKKAPDPGSASLPLPLIKAAVPSIRAHKGTVQGVFCPILKKEEPNDQPQWWPHRLSKEDTVLKV